MILAVKICYRPRMLSKKPRVVFLEFLGDVDQMLVCVCVCACVYVCVRTCACVIGICRNHQLDLSLVVSVVLPNEMQKR